MQDFSDAKTELEILYSEAEKYAVQVHDQSQPTATKKIQKFILLYCKSSRSVSEIVFFYLFSLLFFQFAWFVSLFFICVL